MMLSFSPSVTTGIFTLAAALSGVLLTAVGAFLASTVAAKRQDRRDHEERMWDRNRLLRTERLNCYAEFLDATSKLETTTEYVRDVLSRRARREMAAAWSWAGEASDRVKWQKRKVELLGDEEVIHKALTLSDALQTNYTKLRQNRTAADTSSARNELLDAMQHELDLLVDETSPTVPPRAHRLHWGRRSGVAQVRDGAPSDSARTGSQGRKGD